MAGHRPAIPDQAEGGDQVQSALNNFSILGSGKSHIIATNK
jgi:hypothetical protein